MARKVGRTLGLNGVNRVITVALFLAIFFPMLLLRVPVRAGNAPAAPNKTKEFEWILEQSSRDFGSQTLYVSRNAVRVDNHKNGFVFLARTDDPQECLYRPADKLIAATKNFEWQQIVPMVRKGNPKPNCTIVENVDWKGLRCRKMIESTQAYSLVANDIPVAPKLAQSVCKLYGMPLFSQVPIVNYQGKGKEKPFTTSTWLAPNETYDLQGGSVLRFATRSWRKIPLQEADFKKPMGFKSVNAREVVFSDTQRAVLETVVDDVCFTETRHADKKK